MTPVSAHRLPVEALDRVSRGTWTTPSRFGRGEAADQREVAGDC
jgi:hypothetical protein